jgi:anti-sigma factor RsiW
MLSLLKDDELPSPWKQRAEAHIGECPACRNTMESWTALGAAFARDAASIDALGAEARQRVFMRLSVGATPPPLRGRLGGGLEKPPRMARHYGGRFIRRYVNIPLPAAAVSCAALFLAVFAIAALSVRVYRGNAEPGIQEIAAQIPAEQQTPHELYNARSIPASGINASSMNDVLRYLDSEGGAGYSLISLPAEDFKQLGAPVMVKLPRQAVP